MLIGSEETSIVDGGFVVSCNDSPKALLGYREGEKLNNFYSRLCGKSVTYLSRRSCVLMGDYKERIAIEETEPLYIITFRMIGFIYFLVI